MHPYDLSSVTGVLPPPSHFKFQRVTLTVKQVHRHRSFQTRLPSISYLIDDGPVSLALDTQIHPPPTLDVVSHSHGMALGKGAADGDFQGTMSGDVQVEGAFPSMAYGHYMAMDTMTKTSRIYGWRIELGVSTRMTDAMHFDPTQTPPITSLVCTL